MDIMDEQILKGMVEAILFASGDPVSGERIAQVLGLDKEDAEEVLKDTMESFNRKRAASVLSGWMIRIRCAVIRRALVSGKRWNLGGIRRYPKRQWRSWR